MCFYEYLCISPMGTSVIAVPTLSSTNQEVKKLGLLVCLALLELKKYC